MVHVYTGGDEPVPGYRLVKFLGRGGFGEVWKATAPGGTQCALKLISLDGSQGLKEFRAIRLVKNVRHANLVPITAFWLKDEAGKLLDDGGAATQADTGSKQDTDAVPAELIMAMGLGDKNLWDRLRECQNQGLPGIPPEELLDYMEGSARAIDHLNMPRHELGSGPVAIQHCDIKPQNIMIVGDAAQVCDFGLARVLGDARTTAASLSAAYAAPEFISESKPSKWTDQYSLAISYYELRTGALPFDTGGGQWKIIKDKVDGKLDLSKLAEQEREVIRRATHIEPIKRYPTTLEMVKALRRAYEGKLTDSGKPPATRSGPFVIQKDVEIVPGYRLLRMLGRGSYGEVWEAAAPGGRHVALKIIQHLEAAEGKQEFKALQLIKNVDHEHLMELHAYWLLDKQGEIIPDQLHNKSNAPIASVLVIAGKLANKNLAQRLDECKEQGGGIPVDELLRYMKQAAQAIDHLNLAQHRLDEKMVSIQHRDIKPENIMLAGNTVKVADFGLAKVVEGTSAVIHGDSAGLTLAYAAPEMFENKVTSWTDQYSLALTYYHLRTGTLPFRKGSSTHDIIRAHMEGRLELSHLPPPEEEVIRKATALTPEERYPSCTDMVVGLQEAVGVQPMESMVLPGRSQFGMPGTGTTPGAKGTVSDPKRSGVRDRPRMPAAAATAQDDPFQTMQNVPRRLSPEGVDTAEAGLLDTDRPRRDDFASAPPPWVAQETRQQKKKTQIRIAITVTIGLVVAAVAGIIFVMWQNGRDGKAGEIAKLCDEGRFAEAHDLAGKLASPEREKEQQQVVGKWRKKVEQHRDNGEYENALTEAEKGVSFARSDRDGLRESIRAAAMDKGRNLFKGGEYEQARNLAQLILRGFVDDPQALELVRDADIEIKKLAGAGKLKDLIARANKETDPKRKLPIADEIITAAQNRLEGYLIKADAQVKIEEAKQELEQDYSAAEATLKLARERVPESETNPALKQLATLIQTRKDAVATAVAKSTRYGELVKLIQRIVVEDKQPDFKNHLKDVEAAKDLLKTDLARVAYAECLVQARGTGITKAELAQAQGAAGNATINDPNYAGYDKYVRGLVQQASNKLEDAARDMVLAYQTPPSAPLQLPHRKNRAADVLKQAALEHRQDREFAKDPLKIDRSDKAIQGRLPKLHQLHEWLRTLEHLAPQQLSQSWELRANLALAALYEKDADALKRGLALIGDLVDKAPERDKLGPVAWTLLLHRAKVRETDQPQEAVKSYGLIAELAQKPENAQAVKPAALYQAVLLPAMNLGDKLAKQADADVKKQLAAIFAAAGQVLSGEAPPEGVPDAKRKAIAHYDQAVNLDGDQAAYLIGRGYARLALSPPEFAEARDDSAQAIKRSKESHLGYELAGIVELQEARTLNDPKARVPLLTKARDDFNEAIKLYGEKKDRQSARLLIGRSAAYVELANFSSENTDVKPYLQQAEKDASDALACAILPTPEAIRALANAHEDLAALAHEQDKWESAVAAFTWVIDNTQPQAKPLIDRGRCRFKSVALGGKPKDILDLALTDVENALKQRLGKQEEVEAHYWIGRIHQHRKAFDQALASFTTADRLVKQGKLGAPAIYAFGLADLALDWGTTLLLERNEEAVNRLRSAQTGFLALKGQGVYVEQATAKLRQAYELEADFLLTRAEHLQDQGKPGWEPLKDQALKCADKLAGEAAKNEAALYRGRAHLIAGELENARDTYRGNLPDLAKTDTSHIRLLVAQVQFLTDRRSTRLFVTGKEKQDWNDIIRRADRAVQLAFEQETQLILDPANRLLDEADRLGKELPKARAALSKAATEKDKRVADVQIKALENALAQIREEAGVLAEALQAADQLAANDAENGIKHSPDRLKDIANRLGKLKALTGKPPASDSSAWKDRDQDAVLKLDWGQARGAAGIARSSYAQSLDPKTNEPYRRGAVHLLRDAIRLAPDVPQSLIWRVRLAILIHDFWKGEKSEALKKEALKALDEALKMVPEGSDYWKGLKQWKDKYENPSG